MLSEDDRRFHGVDEDGAIFAPIPARFWKVVVARSSGALESFGFLLEQDLEDVPWEFAAPQRWTPHMVPIDEIERLAGVEFPAEVREGDQTGRSHGEAVSAAIGGTAAAPRAADRGAASSDAAGLAEELAPIFEGWRNQQGGTRVEGSVRLVLNYDVALRTDAEIEQSLATALGLEVHAAALFPDNPDLQRFRLVTIPGVSRIDRADLFDLARLVRSLTGAASVDPDLGTNYYDFDRPPGEAPPAPTGPESADLAFWCWAKEESDLPADRDWALKAVRVPQAWEFSAAAGKPAQGAGVYVFQPDTGVVARHAELGDNLHERPGAANFVEPGHPALDRLTGANPGHGTGTGSVVVSAVEGTMRGAAPLSTLIPVRCVTSVAVFDQSPVAQAIDHARRNGAHVITMSLGGVFSDALHAALRQAVASNIIVVAAAGNCVGEVVWPARYAEAIAVGGVNEADRPWRGSSGGPQVAISGPAEFVLRADPRGPVPDAVTPGQGTSFATAMVAGVAALWLAHHGRDRLIAALPAGRTLQEMFRAAIRATARIPAGFDTGRYGAGIVDARAVLTCDPVACLAAAAPAATRGLLDQVTTLLDSVFGGGSAEAAAPALLDRQNYPELATAAFDRLRAGRSPRVREEAVPPIGLSAGLRARLGANARTFVEVTPIDR